MRQKEIERRLRKALRFPDAWFRTGLMSAELSRQQLSSLRRHFGNRSRPVNGSEHWRYGAFHFILRRVTNEEALVKLLSVAYADPELGEEMVKDIQKHPLAGAAVESSNNSLKRDVAKPRALG
jgi:hypothetical protein